MASSWRYLRREYSPKVPPYVLISYPHLDRGCELSDGLCDYISKVLEDDIYNVAVGRPQVIWTALQRVTIRGPFIRQWRRAQQGKLRSSFEWWTRTIQVVNCPKIVWRTSPSVFLNKVEEMYKAAVRSTTLMQILKALGIRLWDYDERGRVILRIVHRPWDIMRVVTAYLPPVEVLASCGYHAAASMKYWAETGAIKSVEEYFSKFAENGNQKRAYDFQIQRIWKK